MKVKAVLGKRRFDMKKWLKRLIIIAVVVGAALAAYFIYTGITNKAQQEQAFSSMNPARE